VVKKTEEKHERSRREGEERREKREERSRLDRGRLLPYNANRFLSKIERDVVYTVFLEHIILN
jgi:hypothetical protein